MKRFIICFLMTLSLLEVSAGGGWPQHRKGGYFKFGQNFIISSQFYGPAGDLVDITTIGLYTTSFYGEYGFTDRLTGVMYFPFFVRNTLNETMFRQSGNVIPGDDFNSVGDTDIWLKYGFVINKPVVVSGSIILGLPLGATSGGDSQILQTGDGEFNQMIRFDASSSFHPKPFYASVYAAFNNRTNDFSDEVRFGFEVGGTLKKFIPIVKVDVVQSLFNGSAEVIQNSIFSNNTEYVATTLELNYKLNGKIGITASTVIAFSGKNILAAPNWGFGIFTKL